MFSRLGLIALFVILASLGVQAQQREFWLGADISGTTMLEGMGVKLYDINGVERENTLLMKSYGLKQYGARWDIIGLSVYPYWDQRAKMTSSDEETLEKCISNINRMYKKYGTDIMIVETGVEAKQPETGKLFISKLLDAAYTQTDGHCLGVFYWAPELEGHYPLGAFNNHKPTVIMDAFKEFGQKYLYQNH